MLYACRQRLTVNRFSAWISPSPRILVEVVGGCKAGAQQRNLAHYNTCVLLDALSSSMLQCTVALHHARLVTWATGYQRVSSWVNHLRMSPATVLNSASYPPWDDKMRIRSAFGLSILKACPHCRRKVRLSPKTATQRRQSPSSPTVALFCDSVDRLLL